MTLASTLQIRNDALFRAGEKTDGTSDLDAQSLIYLNRAYRALYMGGNEFDPSINEIWWWLKREDNIILDSVIDTGTVNVTNNSNSITFTTAPTPVVDANVNTGWFLKIDEHPDVFKISNHTTSSVTAIIDSVYTGKTNTAAKYKLMKLEYNLNSAAIKLIAPMVGYQSGQFKIFGMSLDRMESEYPLAQVQSGIPTKFADVDEDTIRFNKYASPTQGELIRIDYDYLLKPSDLDDFSDPPLVPTQYRHILSDMTLFFLMADKGDTNAPAMSLQARSGIRAMAKENKDRWSKIGRMGSIAYRQRQVTNNFVRTQTLGLRIG